MHNYRIHTEATEAACKGRCVCIQAVAKSGSCLITQFTNRPAWMVKHIVQQSIFLYIFFFNGGTWFLLRNMEGLNFKIQSRKQLLKNLSRQFLTSAIY